MGHHPGGLWTDPLSYILPASDAAYQQDLQTRASALLHPQSANRYSSLDGLFEGLG
jgi:hypothetical protein